MYVYSYSKTLDGSAPEPPHLTELVELLVLAVLVERVLSVAVQGCGVGIGRRRRRRGRDGLGLVPERGVGVRHPVVPHVDGSPVPGLLEVAEVPGGLPLGLGKVGPVHALGLRVRSLPVPAVLVPAQGLPVGLEVPVLQVLPPVPVVVVLAAVPGAGVVAQHGRGELLHLGGAGVVKHLHGVGEEVVPGGLVVAQGEGLVGGDVADAGVEVLEGVVPDLGAVLGVVQ